MGRQALSEVAARLEEQLQACLAELAEATAQNTRGKARLNLMRSLVHARMALLHALGAANGGPGAGSSSSSSSSSAPAAAEPPSGDCGGSGGAGSGGLQAPAPCAAGATAAAGVPAAEAAQKVLSELDACFHELLQVFRTELDPHTLSVLSTFTATGGSSPSLPTLVSARGGLSSQATPPAAAAPAQADAATVAALARGGGALGMPPSCFVRSVVGMARSHSLCRDRAAFIEWWGMRTRELALVLHQLRSGAAAQLQLEQHLATMAVHFSAVLFVHSWAPEVFTVNLETGEPYRPGTAPMEQDWDRVARALGPSPAQALLFGLLLEWWDATALSLTRERQALAARAVAAPGDIELQEAVLSGLDQVQGAYLVFVNAMCTVSMTGLMTPQQLAEVYLSSWPHMATMVGVFKSVVKLYPVPAAGT